MNTATTIDSLLERMLCSKQWTWDGAWWPRTPEVSAAKSARGQSLPRQHSHSFLEFLFVLEGCGSYGIGARLAPLVPGRVLVFPPGARHDEGYSRKAPPFVHLWISLTGDLFANIHVKRSARSQVIPDFKYFSLFEESGISRTTLAAVLRPPDEHPADIRRLRVQALAESAFARVCELRMNPDYCNIVSASILRTRKMEAVRRHIEECGGRHVHLDGLVRISGYSKYHLLRLFKSHAGISIHGYVDRCRLQNMSKLLRRGLNHKQIAGELGFSCTAALSRWSANMRARH